MVDQNCLAYGSLDLRGVVLEVWQGARGPCLFREIARHWYFAWVYSFVVDRSAAVDALYDVDSR